VNRQDLDEPGLLGALWGWIFLGEQPTPPMLLGCALILLAPRRPPVR